MSSIAIKYTLIDIAVFDYIPFPTLLLCQPAVVEQGLVCVIRQICVTTDDLPTCTAVLTRHLQVQLHVYVVDDAR